jgi:hypothetical protein
MLRRVAQVRNDVSEEGSASITRVRKISEAGITTILFLRSVLQLPITANVVTSSPILVTLMMEALRSSEMSVLTRTTPRNIPEDGILHSHRSENLKSYLKSMFPVFIPKEQVDPFTTPSTWFPFLRLIELARLFIT